ncbi:hypothetical protein PV326_000567, partial [Microctonus aethiopoides]
LTNIRNFIMEKVVTTARAPFWESSCPRKMIMQIEFSNTNILMVSETFMNDNESPVSIPNFDFIQRFQRNEVRNSGVAIYRNETDNNYFITPHLEIQAPYSSNADVMMSTQSELETYVQ